MTTRLVDQLIQGMERSVIGQPLTIRLLAAALLARGHVLLEGVPGLGKTKLVRTLAQVTEGQFKRIQFTPDMMPSDITGNVIWNAKNHEFETLLGPVFANLILADEINRAGPKTQAAMLEAMEEHQVTIHGQTHYLPNPFFVVATQNPVEYEGTYPLPEAQLDRFLFKLVLDYPDEGAETEILRNYVPGTTAEGNSASSPAAPESALTAACSIAEIRKMREQVAAITVEDKVLAYITQLVRQTRAMSSVQLGASPRAGIAIMMASKAWAYLEGREYVIPDDVKMIAAPALRHRIILAPQAELEGMNSDQAIREALVSVPVPR